MLIYRWSVSKKNCSREQKTARLRVFFLKYGHTMGRILGTSVNIPINERKNVKKTRSFFSTYGPSTARIQVVFSWRCSIRCISRPLDTSVRHLVRVLKQELHKHFTLDCQRLVQRSAFEHPNDVVAVPHLEHGLAGCRRQAPAPS